MRPARNGPSRRQRRPENIAGSTGGALTCARREGANRRKARNRAKLRITTISLHVSRASLAERFMRYFWLLIELRGPTGKALDALGDRRVRREEVGEIHAAHAEERRHD